MKVQLLVEAVVVRTKLLFRPTDSKCVSFCDPAFFDQLFSAPDQHPCDFDIWSGAPPSSPVWLALVLHADAQTRVSDTAVLFVVVAAAAVVESFVARVDSVAAADLATFQADYSDFRVDLFVPFLALQVADC